MTPQRCIDTMMTLLLRHVSAGWPFWPMAHLSDSKHGVCDIWYRWFTHDKYFVTKLSISWYFPRFTSLWCLCALYFLHNKTYSTTVITVEHHEPVGGGGARVGAVGWWGYSVGKPGEGEGGHGPRICGQKDLVLVDEEKYPLKYRVQSSEGQKKGVRTAANMYHHPT